MCDSEVVFTSHNSKGAPSYEAKAQITFQITFQRDPFFALRAVALTSDLRDPLRVVGGENYLGSTQVSGVEIRGVFGETRLGGVLIAKTGKVI